MTSPPLPATGGPTAGAPLRQVEVVGVHPAASADPAAAASVARALAAWFTSPFWLAGGVGSLVAAGDAGAFGAAGGAGGLGAAGGAGALGAAGGAGGLVAAGRACASTDGRSLAPNPLARALRAAEASTATLAMPPAARPLADRYHLGRYGSLTSAHYEAVSRAVRDDEPDAWHLDLGEQGCVAATASTLLAWLLAESIRAGFPTYVGAGATPRLAVFAEGPGAVTAVDLVGLVPTPAGLQRRLDFLAAPALAAPLAAYPLLLALVPEASPRLVPTSSAVDTLVPLGPRPRTGRLERPGSRRRRDIRAGRPLSQRLDGVRADTTAAAVRGLRSGKRAVAKTRLWGLVENRDREWSSRDAMASRLATAYPSNPWLSAAAHGFLDQATTPERSA